MFRKGRLIATLILLAAQGAHAEGLSWNYTQLSYQQPSESDVRGASGSVSVSINPNWVMQGRISYAELDRSGRIELGQTRYDLSVGRIFPLTERISMLVSAGYTHLEVRERLNGNNESFGIDAVNLQAGVRARFLERFEADATIGVLADEDDVSDLIYELGLRYHATSNLAVQIGVLGNEDGSFDDVMYEVGVRFSLDD